MAKVAVRNLDIKKGDDKTFYFTHKSGGVPVDLTGYVIMFESSSTLLSQEATVTDVTAGTYQVEFTSANTSQLTKSTVSYEMVYYPTGLLGKRVTKFQGAINVERDWV